MMSVCSYVSQKIASLRGDERGVTAVEYGLIAALMAVALAAIIPFFAGGLNTAFDNV
ncbi:MAG: Flp family type IVb pilin, partial [Gluconacetobacter diazotrophicus]|nr:Flp family type IVb pilin [Gluconacetobacter diazotrophicus]